MLDTSVLIVVALVVVLATNLLYSSSDKSVSPGAGRVEAKYLSIIFSISAFVNFQESVSVFYWSINYNLVSS